MVFVYLFLVDHLAVHLGFHYLSVLQVVGCGFQPRHDLFSALVAKTVVKLLVGYSLALRFQHLVAGFDIVKYTEITIDEQVIYIGLTIEYNGIGILVSRIFCHFQFFICGFSPF